MYHYKIHIKITLWYYLFSVAVKLTQIGSKIKPTIMKDIAVNIVFTVSDYMVGTVAAYSYSYLASYWLVVCNVMDI